MDVKVSVQESSQAYRNINIEIPRAVYKSRFDKAVKEAASRAHVKGFRPGRVPASMIAKMYGDKIHADVMEGLVNTAFDDAVREHKLLVVGHPEISVEGEDKAEEDLKVTAHVPILPEPEIRGYDGLSFEVELIEPKEQDYEKTLLELQRSFAKYEAIDSGVAERADDILVFDYTATVGGEIAPDLKGEGVILRPGSTQFPADFQEAIRKVPVGEESEIAVVLPDDHSEEKLRGQTALYKVSVNKIYQTNMPPLDDELAKLTGRAETLAELKEMLKADLIKDVEERNKHAKEAKFFETVIQANSFEVPQIMVDEEMRSILVEMGVLNPKDQRTKNINMERFRDKLGGQAEFRVRRAIIVDRIVEQEKLEYSDEELDSWLDNLSVEYKQPRAELNKEVGYPKRIKELKQAMARQKILDRLLSSCKITEKVMSS